LGIGFGLGLGRRKDEAASSHGRSCSTRGWA
jgi:hypothetical protein